MPVLELLMWITQFRKSGTLRVKTGETTRELDFDKGALTFSASSDQKGTLGRILIERGVITEEMHNRALELRAERSIGVAKALSVLGLVPEKEILRYLRRKGELELSELFRMTEGEFSFDTGERPELDLIPLEIDLSSLTQQMYQRGWYKFEASGIRVQIPPAS
ncbi:MAG: DUF4388 domain-containing protein [Acidobacteria bacterium]|nr:DUF4388 domain-containing protein [Acidobacteriota bacterium]